MSIEIEAKMKLADPDALAERLTSLGAVHQVELTEINTYFDSPQHSLKTSDQGLRVRIERPVDGPSAVRITHKGPRAHGQLKSRTETEVGVSDAADAADLLEALGYTPILSFEKRRQRWQLGACRIELDTLPYLGHFVEIEGPSDEAVLHARGQIGMEQAPLIHASYIAMLKTHLRENRLQIRTIRFEDDIPVTTIAD